MIALNEKSDSEFEESAKHDSPPRSVESSLNKHDGAYVKELYWPDDKFMAKKKSIAKK